MFPAGEGPALSDGTTGEAGSSGPPPRFHLLRYHGVLAPYARDRGRIVPTKPVEESTAADRDSSTPPCGHRLGWAALLARVFAADISGCPACGGRLRIVAVLTDPASIRNYLEGVGLPAVPPPRAPPQPQFEFAACLLRDSLPAP